MSLVDISAKAPPELELLMGREPLTSRHLVAMGLASIAVHIIAITFFFSLPEVIPPPRRAIITSDLRRAVHLTMPRTFEPTQKAPNLTKVVRPELDVRSQVEAPQSQVPKFRPPQPAPGPISKPVPPPAPIPVIEPPKIQVAAAQPPPLPPSIAPPPTPNGTTAQAPPPPAESKPKIAFENVSPPTAIRVNGPPPDPRLLMHPAPPEFTAPTRPSGGGGISVGDSGDDLTLLPGLNQAQSKGRMGSNLQLLSDANGFDFKPYLLQVLASVRRNWMAVIPQSATMMGRRGSVLIQFIIDRRGGVPKLVIASSSGTEAFDRAAVAGVSASNPFPPLPADFKGDQIRLQLAFSYNAPRH
jgi:TonB family protein